MPSARPVPRTLDGPDDVGAEALAAERDNAPAPEFTPPSSSDRRQHIARRSPREDRLSPLPAGTTEEQFGMLPRITRFLGAAVAAAVGFNIVLSKALPPLWASVCLVLSLIGLSVLPLLREFERDAGRWAWRRVVLGFAVLAPLLLFGLGVVLWNGVGTLPIEAVVCMLLAVGTVASAHLRRQAGLIIAGQMALWLPLIPMSGWVHGLTLLGVGLVSAVIAVHEQRKLDGKELKLRLARDRAQTRARDTLADYEETG